MRNSVKRSRIIGIALVTAMVLALLCASVIGVAAAEVCTHVFNAENGKCTVCGASIAEAKLDNVYYEYVTDALADSAAGDVVYVVDDATFADRLEIPEGVTLYIEQGRVISNLTSGALMANKGTIDGYGIFNAGIVSENFGVINGGRFNDIVTNNEGAEINGGDFGMTVMNNGCINGGTFPSLDNGGTVNGGKFTNVSNKPGATIVGGEFTGVVTNKSVVSGGYFGISAEIYNEDRIIGGVFDGKIVNTNGVITGGAFAKYIDGLFAVTVKSDIAIGEKDIYYYVTLDEAMRAHKDASVAEVIIIDDCVYYDDFILPAGFSLRVEDGVSFTLSAGSGFTNNGTVLGGEFTMPIINNGTIDNGSFKGGVENEGVINSGTFSNIAVINKGEIKDGSFSSAVTNEADGIISLATFKGGVENKGVINSGTFSDTAVINKGEIKGGSFSSAVINEADGVISLATFKGGVENKGIINSGTFSDTAVINKGEIKGGSFNSAVTNEADGVISLANFKGGVENSGVILSGSFDTKTVTNTVDGVIKGGTFSVKVVNSGEINDGTFSADVDNGGAIKGGAFKDAIVVNKVGGYIYSGSFSSEVVNELGAVITKGDALSAPTFTGGVENSGTILNGSFSTVKVVNCASGDVKYGIFTSGVENSGNIYGGTFSAAEVINKNGASIYGGTFEIKVVNEIGGIITKGEGADDVAPVFGAEVENSGKIFNGSFKGGVVNAGEIKDGEFDTVKVVNENNGNIYGGKFASDVENAGNIYGAKFSAVVANKNGGYIFGGSFNAKVVNEKGATIDKGIDADAPVFSAEVENVGEILNGSFDGVVTNLADGVINGGSFYGELRNSGKIAAGSFNGGVINNDGAEIIGGNYGNVSVINNAGAIITDGTFNVKVVNSGIIRGGKFNGNVENIGAIEGGEFYADVTNKAEGVISGGKLYANVDNYGEISGAAEFISIEGISSSVVNNYGVVKGGKFDSSAAFANKEEGTISGGEFKCSVENNGTINGGDFYAAVENKGTIELGNFFADVVNNKKIVGGTFGGNVTNELGAIISGGNFVGTNGLDIVVNNLGTIEGGIFDVPVSNKADAKITDGVFNAKIAENAGEITGGAFRYKDNIESLVKAYMNEYYYVSVYEAVLESADIKDAVIELQVSIVLDKDLTIPAGVTLKGGEYTVSAAEQEALAVLYNNGIIDGGKYTLKVVNTSEIKNGIFNGEVINDGVITYGEFGTVKVINNKNGDIKDGIFTAGVENSGDIYGGTFSVAEVTNKNGAYIYGGTFEVKVVNENGATIEKLDGVDAPTFNGIVDNSGNILNGEFKGGVINTGVIIYGEFDTVKIVNDKGGMIYGGKFGSDVENSGAVYGGTFSASVTNKKDAYIYGGTFASLVVNENGAIIDKGLDVDAPTFNGGVENSGVILNGNFYKEAVINNEDGEIKGGFFYSEVQNNGKIFTGNFTGGVINNDGAEILNGFYDTVNVTNNRGATITGGTFNIKVVNGGTIKGGKFESVVDNNGTIAGGTFENEVTSYAIIIGGIFNAKVINTENGTIRNENDVDPAELRGDVDNYGTISGGIFGTDSSKKVFNHGTISGGVINSAVENENGATISGGRFNYDVLNKANAEITGEAEFYGKVTNAGTIKGGSFIEGEVANNGTVSGGEFYVTVTNNKDIAGGNFYAQVNNDTEDKDGITATISNGKFYAKVVNNGVITGAAEFLTSDKTSADVENNAVISGGTFYRGVVFVNGENGIIKDAVVAHCFVTNNGAIEGGTFDGGAKNLGTIAGGTFNNSKTELGDFISGAVENNGIISGGKFGVVVTNNSTIAGGSFLDALTNNGTIEGDDTLFESDKVITNNGTINGGTFKVTVTNNATIAGGIYEGAVENLADISGGTFGATVTNNATVSGGDFNATVTNNSTIEGGSFYADVTNNGTIKGEKTVFETGTVTNNGTIEGATFNTAVINNGIILGDAKFNSLVTNNEAINGGIFCGPVDNNAVIEGGTFEAEISVVTNKAGANISGGEFKGAVINEADALISGGTFHADVTNAGVIGRNAATNVSALFLGTVTNNGGTIASGIFASAVEGVTFEVMIGEYYAVKLTDALYSYPVYPDLGKVVELLGDYADTEGVAVPAGLTVNADARIDTVYYKDLTYAVNNGAGKTVVVRRDVVLAFSIVIAEDCKLMMESGVSIYAKDDNPDIMIINNGEIISGNYICAVKNNGLISGGRYSKILLDVKGRIDLSNSAEAHKGTVIKMLANKLVGTDIILPEGYAVFSEDRLFPEDPNNPDSADKYLNAIYKYNATMQEGMTIVVGKHAHSDGIASGDDARHWEYCPVCEFVIPASVHEINFKYNPADCYHPDTCSCGRTSGVTVHEYIADPNYCDYECSLCGQINENPTPHEDSDGDWCCDLSVGKDENGEDIICGKNMLALTEGEKVILLLASGLTALIIAAALFFFFKSKINDKADIAGIIKKY